MHEPISLIADLLELLDPERRYEFEERAGIIEFDAGQTRDQAELLALVDLLRAHPAALLGVTTFEVEAGGGTTYLLVTDVNRARDQLAAEGATVKAIHFLRALLDERFAGLAKLTRR